MKTMVALHKLTLLLHVFFLLNTALKCIYPSYKLQMQINLLPSLIHAQLWLSKQQVCRFASNLEHKCLCALFSLSPINLLITTPPSIRINHHELAPCLRILGLNYIKQIQGKVLRKEIEMEIKNCCYHGSFSRISFSRAFQI